MTEYKKVEVLLPEDIAEKFNMAPAPVRLTRDEIYKPTLREIIRAAKETAKEEFRDSLKENNEISDYASKREELMKECTHPENHRIYPDHTRDNHYNDSLVWHCTACGYARYKEDSDA